MNYIEIDTHIYFSDTSLVSQNGCLTVAYMHIISTDKLGSSLPNIYFRINKAVTVSISVYIKNSYAMQLTFIIILKPK